MSTMTSLELKPIAKRLRREFESIMRDHQSPDRFQWDWWHLPGRYTHLRTPAAKFFSNDSYADLVAGLEKFGRETLGCPSISPVWLSCYVNGCEQRLHADRPHGPWAFVLALTPAKRVFQGGETLILKPETLSFWERNRLNVAGGAFEESEIVDRIASMSGRLLVFDPRIPHGVSPVSGTVDPLQGRLVIHGWFTQPSPFVEGSLKPLAVEPLLKRFDERLGDAYEELASALAGARPSTGTIAFRIRISPSGKVTGVKKLASSLRSSSVKQTRSEEKWLTRLVENEFGGMKFRSAKNSTQLTLPLSFES